MSQLILSLRDAGAAPLSLIGGKAASLGRLLGAGIPVPDGVVLTTEAFSAAIREGGLSEKIAQELSRLDVSRLRAEEYWDIAQRVRGSFIATKLPAALLDELAVALTALGETELLVVRSSAPHEDGEEHAYAGLHDTFVGVSGERAVADAVRLVWASLYGERALAAYASAGDDPLRHSMAVIIQPLVAAERSGVTFTKGPLEQHTGTVEAVWGLGEALVSGRVEPDRWFVDRETGNVTEHFDARRDNRLVASEGGPVLEPLSEEMAARPPLGSDEVSRVWELALEAERTFGAPQDCEWAWGHERPLLTQSRPITAWTPDSPFAELTPPSIEHLATLRATIEGDVLPAMWSEANALAVIALDELPDNELADEAQRRVEAVSHWRHVYRTTLIPFVHGTRAFGRLWAETMPDSDPFGFVELLVRSPEEYVTHVQVLAELDIDPAKTPSAAANRDELEEVFLGKVPIARLDEARELLELGRASWRVRDDDNLYLARVEREAERAVAEIERRLAATAGETVSVLGPSARERLEGSAAVLRDLRAYSIDVTTQKIGDVDTAVRPRQMLGHPAGPGVGSGPARVALCAADVAALMPGEVLVVDSLDPRGAALATRAAAIVERRGGMLVHGAIVAREHGIPCVTGIDAATEIIRPGEPLVVDGYLGIVVLESV